MSYPEQNDGSVKTRPRFLTLLCYLTIFGSSYIIISSLSSLADLDHMLRIMTESMERAESMFAKAMQNDVQAKEKLEQIMADISLASTRSNMRDHYIFLLVSNLLTLVGANFMLRLKKNGFRLYILGCLIGVVAPLLVFGADNFLGFAYALTGALFSGLFILLYALKIKHMD